MPNIERIMVPIPLVVLLILLLIFFTPTFPVQVSRFDGCSFCPPSEMARWSNYSEPQPAILVGLAGFSWSSWTETFDAGTSYEYSSNPILILAHVVLAVAVPLVLVLRAKGAGNWRRIDMRRRYWRAALWGIGFYLLVLSVLWAWSYMIFYGTLASSPGIDPFLVAMTGTFFLSGTGLSMMMLSVRSRAIWPAP